MLYRIKETTDNKYLGKLLELEEIYQGMEIFLDDFNFKISRIIDSKQGVTISNANYVVILKVDQKPTITFE